MDKTDATLKHDIEAELEWDPAIRGSSIGVAVKNGVATLTGHIDTFAEKRAIEKALQRVSGVRAIALELDVRLAPGHRRSDTDIAESVEQALKWNTLVPVNRIRVTVDKGWVTLQGEVEWDYQRRAAEAAVRPLIGVVGMSNNLTIVPKVTPVKLQTRIAEALRRQVEREIDRLEVKVDGGKVTLRGKVNSWHERAAAQGVAWSAPGVHSVINELEVA
ncbi:MAG TPA: BON domain-containing protein [Caldimonas sp.]|nr:BON domain-containing protein [Caldimonas sp.]